MKKNSTRRVCHEFDNHKQCLCLVEGPKIALQRPNPRWAALLFVTLELFA
jgi:hypothetical protein